MIEKVSEDDWLQWVNSPVTKVFKEYLTEVQNEAIEKLINADPGTFSTVEKYALRCAQLRSFVDGMAQATDFGLLKEVLSEMKEEKATLYGY